MHAMDQARLSKLVRQHAQTSRLLGVDFVPAYSSAAEEGAMPPPMPNGTVPQPQSLGRGLFGAADETPPEVVVLPVGFKRPDRNPKSVQAKLDELRRRYEADAPHQHFVTAHTNIVFGEGDPCAKLMFIGEAPGAEEDRTGRPFVGRAGQLLNKMIAAMGLQREQVYIGNVLKTRPPDNATPTTDEIKLCAPYLFEQIAIIDPEVIVTLGLPATRAVLDSVDSMSRLRGRWSQFQAGAPSGRKIPVMPTYHPAFLLRSYTTENRAKVWSDLQQVMTRLGLATTGQKPD